MKTKLFQVLLNKKEDTPLWQSLFNITCSIFLLFKPLDVKISPLA